MEDPALAWFRPVLQNKGTDNSDVKEMIIRGSYEKLPNLLIIILSQSRMVLSNHSVGVVSVQSGMAVPVVFYAVKWECAFWRNDHKFAGGMVKNNINRRFNHVNLRGTLLLLTAFGCCDDRARFRATMESDGLVRFLFHRIKDILFISKFFKRNTRLFQSLYTRSYTLLLSREWSQEHARNPLCSRRLYWVYQKIR